MAEISEEQRSWPTDDAAEPVIETLKRKIEAQRRRKKTYRALVNRDAPTEEPPTDA